MVRGALEKPQPFQCRNVDAINYLPTADHCSLKFMSFMTWRKPFQSTFLIFISRFTFSIALSFIVMQNKGSIEISVE